MVLKRMIPELYDSFAPLRSKPVKEVVEKPVVADAKSSISKVIGILTEAGAYDAFIPLSGRVVSITMRDVLESRHIDYAKSSAVGKIAPSLSYESNIGYASRIMSHYRLRALPVLERGR
jgi:CBS domain-containing protein